MTLRKFPIKVISMKFNLSLWTLPLLLLGVIPNYGEQKVQSLAVISSPNQQLKARLYINHKDRVCYTLNIDGNIIIEESPIGLTVDNIDLGIGSRLEKIKEEIIHESYAKSKNTSGTKNHCLEATIKFIHKKSQQEWILTCRAYNDGFAYRYDIPGKNERLLNEERSSWSLPEKTTLWTTIDGKEDKGGIQKFQASKSSLLTDHKEAILSLPVLLKYPNGRYAAINEVGVIDYSGASLLPNKPRNLQCIFTEDKQGWHLNGNIRSPWRITMIGPDLNSLINCDMNRRLSEMPDDEFFPNGCNSDWIQPGRAYSNHLSSGEAGLVWLDQKNIIDEIAEMKFEYYLVSAGWEDPAFGWREKGENPWLKIKELCHYAKTKGVGIWLSKSRFHNAHIHGLESENFRETFFRHCQSSGVSGIHIDSIKRNGHETQDFILDCLLMGAKYKIMVSFANAGSLSGLSKTWPHLMNWGGVRHPMHNENTNRPVHQYALSPFTRCLTERTDYAPLLMQRANSRGATLPLQMANSIIMTSPLMTMAGDTKNSLDSSLTPFLNELPVVWDKTLVLPGNQIGELVAMAKQKGDDWYVALINGEMKTKTYQLDLSFLSSKQYEATYYQDPKELPNVVYGGADPYHVVVDVDGWDKLILGAKGLNQKSDIFHLVWADGKLIRKDGKFQHLSDLEPKIITGEADIILSKTKKDGRAEAPIGRKNYSNYTRFTGNHLVEYQLKQEFVRFETYIGMPNYRQRNYGSAQYHIGPNSLAEFSLNTNPEIVVRKDRVNQHDQIKIKMLPGGGFVGIFNVLR
ncbi:MAG: glycoside hydrolase family 97 N-terminal domain-containing protein [Planctomycetes bacterium]|nr:glycoside hydrolase family 97 N-terminal domain-containing protein [Planctomycetota bacterium]